MDADKLNEAAEKYFKEESAFRPPCLCKGFVFDAFLAGAQWLMTQPLADRLTEEEKEKHKATYNRLVALQKEALKDHDDFTVNITAAQLGTFTQIFGKELFNEK